VRMELQFSKNEKVVSAKIVYEIVTELLSIEDELDREKEHLWAIGLNNQHQIKYIDLVHLGTVNSCVCGPMEIYRRGCIKGVVSLIVAHNHPSGNPEPSFEDRKMTKRLKEAGEILGIKFLDHVIVGQDKYYGFSDEGQL